MKKFIFLLSIIIIPSYYVANAQNVYPVTSGELLFQFSDTELANSDVTDNPMRFTLFFHWGQYYHFDMTNNIGFFSGLAIRNVGFIYDEDNVPQKTIRRSYNLGVPLALKLGAFNKHFYLFGGGEYELLFHYKGKRWYSGEREGTKSKDTEWFSDKTERFVPSLFAGMQFPGGINLKFKYYMGDFLNLDYVGNDLGVADVDFANFTKHNMFYISLSWQFRTDAIKSYLSSEDKVVLK